MPILSLFYRQGNWGQKGEVIAQGYLAGQFCVWEANLGNPAPEPVLLTGDIHHHRGAAPVATLDPALLQACFRPYSSLAGQAVAWFSGNPSIDW